MQFFDDLSDFVASEGPFEGLIGFSEGGCVAATMMMEDAHRPSSTLGFKCGIFFCGLTPIRLDALRETDGKLQYLDPSVDGVLLHIPTAHIWSPDGNIDPGMGRTLVHLSEKGLREELVHHLGHCIPGQLSDEGLVETVRIINRTIEKARLV